MKKTKWTEARIQKFIEHLTRSGALNCQPNYAIRYWLPSLSADAPISEPVRADIPFKSRVESQTTGWTLAMHPVSEEFKREWRQIRKLWNDSHRYDKVGRAMWEWR